MTYSRKRYWLAMAAAFVIAAATDALLIWLRPAHIGLWAMAMVAVIFALGLLAYFSQDEIQHQNSMRAWYWGGCLAMAFAVMPFVLIVSNTMLLAMADFLPHPAPVRHTPKLYFILGVLVTVLLQSVGFFLARIVLRFRS